MGNLLIDLIQAGKIRSTAQLKSAYRTVVMKTHPDAAGSERYLDSYLKLNDQYIEARAYLEGLAAGRPGFESPERANQRLAFFQQLAVIESLEIPYAFHTDLDAEKLFLARTSARDAIAGWRVDLAELYAAADAEYLRIKTAKPSGPYLKHALALNVRPLVHDLIAFHLTARKVYARQARQNLSGIMHQLSESNCPALRRFLSLLLDDMNNGPAVLG